MITWFDAILVTLWAAVTVVALRRGLAGGLWAILAVGALWLCNLAPQPAVAVAFGVLLSFLAAWLAGRAFRRIPAQVWHLWAGGVGGAALGLVAVTTLALGFPIKLGLYPSDRLPAPLYYAVYNSLFVQQLTGLFGAAPAVRRLVAPDQVRRGVLD